ncbi:MAG TPA: fused MFS/spermidine synthase, partial [Myxococcota bacterium]|nr:fused MFS/spermidine synthase [Myxococcota bacterium]
MARPLVYLLFLVSGIAGLVYQVIWVRVFGNVFGNTVHSAAVVTAVFMAGLGLGSWLAGRLADRAWRRARATPLLLYALSELAIGALGLGLAWLLPELDALSAAVSTYSLGPDGWHELSTGSLALRYVLGALLLAPSTLLMGGTLSLLVRAVVGADLEAAPARIGLLYGLNTLGAAVGALATDFSLVPSLGLLGSQLLAAGLNAAAGLGALAVWRAHRRQAPAPAPAPADAPEASAPRTDGARRPLGAASAALLLTGFAAMGLEIVWFRFLGYVLGGYRAVFSLVLAVLLLGLFLGALAGGWLARRLRRPEVLFAGAQALLVLSALGALMTFDGGALRAQADALREGYRAAGPSLRALYELWVNATPMLWLVALPAVCMGLAYPVANALVQRTEAAVGGRAGLLYLANTSGNVLGSLGAGFLLLPWLGVQACTGLFALAALAGAGCLLLHPDGRAPRARRAILLALGAGLAGVAAFGALPRNLLVRESFAGDLPEVEHRVLALREGVNETLMVVEVPGFARALFTNGHNMSGTRPSSLRYMRAFAHLPLLMQAHPRRALVICFGVGNTLYAASLHARLERLEVVDLSRDVLEHAGYFAATNHDVLDDPRVQVFVNDGRHHLRMQPEGRYDLVTLEPPPIGFAGVSSLYTREFYALVRSRLAPGGALTQWLPGLQVAEAGELALVRAFLDVFPDAVLLNGFGTHMILLGRRDAPPGLPLDTVLANLAAEPAVRASLEEVALARPTELVGAFAASAGTLAAATRGVAPVSDDRPVLEYSVRSVLRHTRQPAALFDPAGARAWCPACFGA